jgi:hypothetical protein
MSNLIRYEFVRRSVPIGDRQGWVLNAEPDFDQTFQHNQAIALQINRLVQRVTHGESITFPFDVGHFLSAEVVQQEMTRRWEAASKVV